MTQFLVQFSATFIGDPKDLLLQSLEHGKGRFKLFEHQGKSEVSLHCFHFFSMPRGEIKVQVSQPQKIPVGS